MYKPRIIGEEIKAIREQHGMTQTEFANVLGYNSHHYVNRLENDKIYPCHLVESALLLIKAKKISIEDLNINRKQAGYEI